MVLWVMQANGSNPRQLGGVTVVNNTRISWLPNSLDIAFTQRVGDDRVPTSAIFIVDAATGRNVRRITPERIQCMEPAWSADPAVLALIRELVPRPGRKYYDLFLFNRTNGQFLQVTRDRYFGHPAWSPDGAQIAVHDRRSGGASIWLVNSNGTGEPTSLFRRPAGFVHNEPDWGVPGSPPPFPATTPGPAPTPVVTGEPGRGIDYVAVLREFGEARGWPVDSIQVQTGAIRSYRIRTRLERDGLRDAAVFIRVAETPEKAAEDIQSSMESARRSGEGRWQPVSVSGLPGNCKAWYHKFTWHMYHVLMDNVRIFAAQGKAFQAPSDHPVHTTCKKLAEEYVVDITNRVANAVRAAGSGPNRP
jgi:Tol biopolymer transport system component